MTRTHGVASTYRDGKCRCDPCRWANTAACLRERADRAARLAEDPTLAVHGSFSTYANWGCRCEPCSAANAARLANYRQAKAGAR